MKYCPYCGTKLEESMKFCPECGQNLIMEEREPVQEKPKDVRTDTVTIERADPTYYSDEKGVRITATRLIIGSKTYAMANITSIERKIDPPNRRPGIIMAVIGVFILVICAVFESMSGILLGVFVLLGGILWAALVKPTYHLKVTSAAGEESPLTSKDGKYINQLVVAVNEALIKRG
ncbi:MAG TPA: DUF6232 family protein [Dehalococcoidia bacterium]|nr:DUF6232 family protein [Dehalococcoidia bacterium]